MSPDARYSETSIAKWPFFDQKRIEKKVLFPMGGIQRAGTGKNKKVTEISPLLAFWPEGLGIKFL